MGLIELKHGKPQLKHHGYMGVSENVVYPILTNGFADHYPVFKWLFHWEYTLFSDKPISLYELISSNSPWFLWSFGEFPPYEVVVDCPNGNQIGLSLIVAGSLPYSRQLNLPL